MPNHLVTKGCRIQHLHAVDGGAKWDELWLDAAAQSGAPTGVLPGRLVRRQRPDPTLLEEAAE